MAIIRKILEATGMPKAKNKAEREVSKDIRQGAETQTNRDVTRISRQLEEKQNKSFFGRMLSSRIVQKQSGRKGGGRYVIAGGVTYKVAGNPSSRGRRFAGRPRESFKPRIDPFTGKMVRLPALAYYRLVRRYNMMLRGRAAGSIQAQQAMLARRGVPPSIAAQLLAQRQAQAIQEFQEPQMQQPMPQQAIQQMRPPVQRVPYPASSIRQRPIRMPFQRPVQVMPQQLPIQEPQYREEIDLLTGRPHLVPNWAAGRKERWTFD